MLHKLALILLATVMVCTAETAQDSQKKGDSLATVLKKIETGMKKIKTLEADFIQEKKLAILEQPISITGKLYMATHKLAWYTLTPIKSKTIIIHKELQQWDEDSDQIQKVDLSKQASFKAILEQMQMWFNGDYSKVNKQFAAKFGASPQIITFTPIKSTTGMAISSITVEFEKNYRYIKAIKIKEIDGDSMKLMFKATKLNRTIDSKIWKIKD